MSGLEPLMGNAARREERAKERAGGGFDDVERPKHYTEGLHPMQHAISVIDAWKLTFCCGQVVKYVQRAGRKIEGDTSEEAMRIKDLRKAKWYLEHEIERLEAERAP